MSHNNTFGMILVGDSYMDKVPVGSRIKFLKEKQAYTVQASNRFYSVCTKPFNAQKTFLYTVIDWYNQLRGTENLVFGMGAETKEDCEEMLERLTNAESDVSSRNWCNLDVESVKLPKIIKSNKE
jgi:hypothetical protein